MRLKAGNLKRESVLTIQREASVRSLVTIDSQLGYVRGGSAIPNAGAVGSLGASSGGGNIRPGRPVGSGGLGATGGGGSIGAGRPVGSGGLGATSGGGGVRPGRPVGSGGLGATSGGGGVTQGRPVGSGGLGSTSGNSGSISRPGRPVGSGGLGATSGNSGSISRPGRPVGSGGLGATSGNSGSISRPGRPVGGGGLGATSGNSGSISRPGRPVGSGGLGATSGNSGAVSSGRPVGSGGLGATNGGGGSRISKGGALKGGSLKGGKRSGAKKPARPYVRSPQNRTSDDGQPLYGFIELSAKREWTAGFLGDWQIVAFKAELNGQLWTPETPGELLADPGTNPYLDPEEYPSLGWETPTLCRVLIVPEDDGRYESVKAGFDTPDPEGKIAQTFTLTVDMSTAAGTYSGVIPLAPSGYTNFIAGVQLTAAEE